MFRRKETEEAAAVRQENERLQREVAAVGAECLKHRARATWLQHEMVALRERLAKVETDAAGSVYEEELGERAPGDTTQPLAPQTTSVSEEALTPDAYYATYSNTENFTEAEKDQAVAALAGHNTALLKDHEVLATTLQQQHMAMRQQKRETDEIIESLRREVGKLTETQKRKRGKSVASEGPNSLSEVLQHRLEQAEAKHKLLEAKINALRSQRNEAREWIQNELLRRQAQEQEELQIATTIQNLKEPPRLASWVPGEEQQAYVTKLEVLEERVSTLRRQRNQAYEQLDRRMKMERDGCVTPLSGPRGKEARQFSGKPQEGIDLHAEPSLDALAQTVHSEDEAAEDGPVMHIPLIGVMEPSDRTKAAKKPEKVQKRLEKQKRKLEGKVGQLCQEAWEQQQHLAAAMLESEAQREQLSQLHDTINQLRETVRELQSQRSAPPSPLTSPSFGNSPASVVLGKVEGDEAAPAPSNILSHPTAPQHVLTSALCRDGQ
eukprot:TRINITY_DN16782_c0_g1_i1.p1 TRINITY_DN16782_c0_g1~~TRINITY_DN16782_c0_g1_i1.p1  ORF type:complete len:494 (+),score=199.30 TRINITY_DN16782_c0_g1_i1:108-1589(+)